MEVILGLTCVIFGIIAFCWADNNSSNGCLGGVALGFIIVGAIFIIFKLCGGYDSTESNFYDDHGYSAYKERRDDALERATKALKDGDDGMAKAWIQKGQEAQDGMNNAQKNR